MLLKFVRIIIVVVFYYNTNDCIHILTTKLVLFMIYIALINQTKTCSHASLYLLWSRALSK